MRLTLYMPKLRVISDAEATRLMQRVLYAAVAAHPGDDLSVVGVTAVYTSPDRGRVVIGDIYPKG